MSDYFIANAEWCGFHCLFVLKILHLSQCTSLFWSHWLPCLMTQSRQSYGWTHLASSLQKHHGIRIRLTLSHPDVSAMIRKKKWIANGKYVLKDSSIPVVLMPGSVQELHEESLYLQRVKVTLGNRALAGVSQLPPWYHDITSLSVISQCAGLYRSPWACLFVCLLFFFCVIKGLNMKHNVKD